MSACVPFRVSNAFNHPKWKEVMTEEMKAGEKNQTWDSIEQHAMFCKWVFTLKLKSNRDIEI